jgi:hypothetical protein
MSYKVEYNGASGLWELKVVRPHMDDKVIGLFYGEATAKIVMTALEVLDTANED